MSRTKGSEEGWKKLLDKLYENFKGRYEPYKSDIILIAVLRLIANSRIRFTLNDIYEEVLDILSKLKTKPVEITPRSLSAPVGFWLVGIGLLEKINDSPATYTPTFELTEENLRVINKYYHSFMEILFEKYGKAE